MLQNRLLDFGEEARQQGFWGVTENPLSNSKDTLLISGEINNPSRNGLKNSYYFDSQSIVFRCLSCPKKE